MEDKWRIVKEQIGGGKRVEEGGLCPHSSRDGRAQVSHHWPVRCTWEVWATSLDPAGGSGSPGTQTSASWGLRAAGHTCFERSIFFSFGPDSLENWSFC